nr:MAG TPA: hypothetical protein [Caudoviricetes sp.]
MGLIFLFLVVRCSWCSWLYTTIYIYIFLSPLVFHLYFLKSIIDKTPRTQRTPRTART